MPYGPSVVDDLKAQVRRYFVLMVKHRWIGIFVAWLIALAGWTGVAMLPDTYTSKARVYVDTQSMLRPLLRGLAIEPNIDTELKLVQQTLLSRPNLERVMRMADLDVRVNDEVGQQVMRTEIADNTSIKAEGNGLFSISHEHGSPQVAHEVVRAFLTIFVEGNLGEKRSDMEMARSFLEAQIQDYEQKLRESEQAIAEFKREHIDYLSGDNSFAARYEQARDRLERARAELTDAQRRRDSIAAELQAIPEMVPATGSNFGPATGLEQRILEMESRLNELLIHYTDAHPDVVATERRLEELQAEMQKQQEAYAESGILAEGEGVPNPMREQIRLLLVQEQANVATLASRVERFEQEVDDLRQHAGGRPEIDNELAKLQYNYRLQKQRYDQFVSRNEAARLSQQRDVRASQVQFRVVEPPQVPAKPDGPQRLLLFTVVLFFSVAGGFAASFGRAYLDGSFVGIADLKAAIGLPVLGGVGMVLLPREIYLKRLRRTLALCCIAALLAGYAAVVAVEVHQGFPNVLAGSAQTADSAAPQHGKRAITGGVFTDGLG